MRNKIFPFILGIALCGVLPAFAMDLPEKAEDCDIRFITPLKKDMDSTQQLAAIQSFLKNSLDPEYEIDESKLSVPESRVHSHLFNVCTHNDGSKWVPGNGGLQRFLGFCYLKKAINHFGLKHIDVAETRFCYKDQKLILINVDDVNFKLKNIPFITSDSFSSYSLYVGDERLQGHTEEEGKELKILRDQIGFTDIEMWANLRRKDGKIYVIDTEFRSFGRLQESYFDISSGFRFAFTKELDYGQVYTIKERENIFICDSTF